MTKGRFVTVQAADGFKASAYRADPAAGGKGTVVVLQELFGVNRHIRKVCDNYAARGYTALAPALFDRVAPGVELGYGPEDVRRGIELRDAQPVGLVLRDVQAAIDVLRLTGRVGVVGFCWGGTLAFLAAARLSGLSAAVGYYGSMIPDFCEETPRVPVLLHFGAKDHTVPPNRLELVRQNRPDVEIEVYAAGHGFNCDERPGFDRALADLAFERTLSFLSRELSGGSHG
ncbi:MAG TPA: dienelactone hydrolase family protein [Novosphingobium sp.]